MDMNDIVSNVLNADGTFEVLCEYLMMRVH